MLNAAAATATNYTPWIFGTITAAAVLGAASFAFRGNSARALIDLQKDEISAHKEKLARIEAERDALAEQANQREQYVLFLKELATGEHALDKMRDVVAALRQDINADAEQRQREHNKLFEMLRTPTGRGKGADRTRGR